MKKVSLFLLLAILLTSCSRNPDFVTSSYTLSNPHSSHIFIYDLDSEELITYSCDNTDKVFPASITKLLTALSALDILSADTIITPGDEVYLPAAGSSSAYIRPYHQLSLEMLIEAMMIPSGNDAAYAIAAACGKELADDSVEYNEAIEVFVEYMNAYAANIGCTNSNFTSPDGFSGSDHYSTLADMAIIAKEATSNDIIMKYAGLSSVDVTYASGHINTWTNTNEMLDPNSKYYNDHVCGLKTGSLSKNFSLITIFDDGDTRLLIGTFGSKTDEGRYIDTQNIIFNECN
ncbi:MAG: D-alanyl-D-alanine carboxypeptidase [Ruminococcaceae bacterium]|nr:D-alanyl-D-alanine carboxypeptidase [Oscillospiraceae bacterium]